MRPGMIWFTRILSAASSSASVFASAETDARSTVESPRFGIGSFTDADVDIRIEPPPRCLHRRHRRPDHAQRAEQQQIHRVLPRRIVKRHGRAGRRAAGVGEQQIDAAESFDRLLSPGGDLIAVADVHRHREHVSRRPPTSRFAASSIDAGVVDEIETIAPSRASASATA